MASIIDTTDLTRSQSRRRLFFLTAGLALFALVMLRFVVLPWVTGTQAPGFTAALASTLDSLSVAVASSIALGSLLYWLGAGRLPPAEMTVIESREIAETLDRALEGTSEWWYRGHTGRHLRSVTLPALARQARGQNRTIAVSIQVLDPSDPQACEYYATYRRGLRTAAQDAQWTAERVSKELYATILSAFTWSTREPLLDFTVAVHGTVSVYRVDLSSRMAVITKEDPKEPALRCDSGTFFHSSYREDLRMARQQGRELDRRLRHGDLNEATVDSVRTLFRDLALDSPKLASDTFVKEIIDVATRAENPYP